MKYYVSIALTDLTLDYKEPVKTVRIPFKLNSEIGHQYLSGGILTEKKIPQKVPMASFAQLLKNPGELVSTDLLNFSEYQQHLALFATLTFAERNKNRFPAANKVEVADAVVQIAKNLLTAGDVQIAGLEADEQFIKK